MNCYKNITITPYSELMDTPRGLSFHKGGPIWPSWEDEINRHKIGNDFVDDKPEDTCPKEVVEEDLYWCGAIVNHYGHQIVDFISRIIFYKDKLNSKGKLCFSVHPRSGITDITKAPQFFKEMLNWFEIPHEKVFIVHRPIKSTKLYSTPQGEVYNSDIANYHYYKLLSNNKTKLSLKSNIDERLLYVSRAGQKTGLIAGEKYLESYLEKEGVTVIRPETLSLEEQLHLYKSRKNIIFSEGSAIHSLQLLGSLDCNIIVLNRREGERIAYYPLKHRGAQVKYVEVGSNIYGLNMSGGEAPELGVCVPKINNMIRFIKSLGLNYHNFCEKTFNATVQQDIEKWIKKEQSSIRKNVPGSAELISQRLKENGASLNLIKLVETDHITKGFSGWLFLTGGANSVASIYNNPKSTPWINGWKSLLEKRNNILSSKGIQYIHVVAPEKLSIYPQYLNNDVNFFKKGPANVLNEVIGQRSYYINPTAYLIAQSKNRLVYHKTDSHWNFNGAYATYQLIMCKLGLEQNLEILNKKRAYIEIPMDLGGKLTPVLKEKVFFNAPPNHVQRVWANELVRYKEENKLDNNVGLHVGSSVRFKNSKAHQTKKIVIFGDSFSEYRPHYLTGILSETFSEVLFVWGINIDFDLVFEEQPDVVISECAERFMPNNVPDDSFDYYERIQSAIQCNIDANKRK